MHIFGKIIAACLLLLVAVSGAQAQSLEEMAKRFENCPKAEYTHVGPLLMRLARAMAPKEDMEEMGPVGRAMLENVSEMALLDLEECSEEDKAAFRAAVEGWVPDGYTAIVEKEIVESSDENVAGMRCFMRAAKKKNYELILLDVKACQCTYLNGDLTEELIREIASQEPKATEK